jgi:Flp pilus assembly protein TadD
VLGPDAIGNAAELVSLAQEGLADPLNKADALCTLALAHYRAGQWDEALARLGEAAVPAPRAWLTWPVLAMVHHRLGHADEARRWLDKAAARHQEIVNQLAGPGGGFALPEDWLEFETLYAEARALLTGGRSDAPRP